jgi:hypothetical protein
MPFFGRKPVKKKTTDFSSRSEGFPCDGFSSYKELPCPILLFYKKTLL